MGRFERYWAYESPAFDQIKFGKRLFSGLKTVYDADKFDIYDFGERCCRLWHMLPGSVRETEPFYTLIYADEPLSWRDEAQSGKLFEQAFAYYDHDDHPSSRYDKLFPDMQDNVKEQAVTPDRE